MEARDGAAEADRPFVHVGRLWILGVDEERAVDAGLEAVAGLRAKLGAPTPVQDRLLRSYQGAFLVLRAKHGVWPPTRLRNIREGFSLMDRAVEEAPDHAAIRYIRLMSGFYLPGFFGRGDEVDADMDALVRLLPDARREFPGGLYPEVVAFVLEHGDPDPARAAALEALR